MVPGSGLGFLVVEVDFRDRIGGSRNPAGMRPSFRIAAFGALVLVFACGDDGGDMALPDDASTSAGQGNATSPTGSVDTSTGDEPDPTTRGTDATGEPATSSGGVGSSSSSGFGTTTGGTGSTSGGEVDESCQAIGAQNFECDADGTSLAQYEAWCQELLDGFSPMCAELIIPCWECTSSVTCEVFNGDLAECDPSCDPFWEACGFSSWPEDSGRLGRGRR